MRPLRRLYQAAAGWGRAIRGSLAFLVVIGIGVVGYQILGLSFGDALYQTVITITTVGYGEIGDVTGAYQIFTIALILVGVGSALYALGGFVEHLIEGRLQETLERRRMRKDIAALAGHIIVCGSGRVGRTMAQAVAAAERDADIVVVDSDPERLTSSRYTVFGDATEDDVLREAGIERARMLVATLARDSDNVYVALAARSLNPDLFIVARAHDLSAEPKMRQAGADRVVNPQEIGGRRLAAFALQPNVVEFLDVVMQDGGIEWRLEEIPIGSASPLAGATLGTADIRATTGALVLALRDGSGAFRTAPGPESALAPRDVLIAVGTPEQLAALEGVASDR